MSGHAMFYRGDPTGGSLGSASYKAASKYIGAQSGPIWLTSLVGWRSGHLPSDNLGSTYTAAIQALTASGTQFAESPVICGHVIRIPADGEWGSIANGYNLHDTDPTLVAEKWYLLETYFNNNTAYGAHVSCQGEFDAVDTYGSGSVSVSAAETIKVGCFAPLTGFFGLGMYSTFEGYIAEVYCGTKRRGRDLFYDDFASGDFSAWDSASTWINFADATINTGVGCTIVPRPNWKRYNPSCGDTGVRVAPIRIPLGNVGGPLITDH